MLQYQAFECDADVVHASLNELGGQGWRLHTCHPMTIRGQAEVDSVRYAIVMERLIEDPSETEVDDAPEGIAMAG